jgi:hypothetical protein
MANKMKSSQNLGGSKILRIYIVYGTRKETTQQETSESSLIGMQEKEKNKDKQEDNKKKDKDNTEDKRIPEAKGDSCSDLFWSSRFQKQAPRQASSPQHHGS